MKTAMQLSRNSGVWALVLLLAALGWSGDTAAAKRLQETDRSIVYSNGWNPGNTTYPWSGGTATYTATIGANATIAFTGTGIDWIGYRGRFGGIVRVFLDGTLVAVIDTYSATEQPSVVVYSSPSLPFGGHTLTVELTGLMFPLAVSSETVVDAFDIY